MVALREKLECEFQRELLVQLKGNLEHESWAFRFGVEILVQLTARLSSSSQESGRHGMRLLVIWRIDANGPSPKESASLRPVLKS